MPPESNEHTARVRIFTPKEEFPFAGHPNVGTAWLVRLRGTLFGKEVNDLITFEEKAGVVPIEIDAFPDTNRPRAAFLTAPEPWRVLVPDIPAAAAAEMLGLAPQDVLTARHRPCVATAGLPFLIVQLASQDALAQSRGCPEAFNRLGGTLGASRVLAYVLGMETSGPPGISLKVEARMHRADGSEDAGTGSAACALVGLLSSTLPYVGQRSPGKVRGEQYVKVEISQGVAMGRPSLLFAEAKRTPLGLEKMGQGKWDVGKVRVGGACVPMFRGEVRPEILE